MMRATTSDIHRRTMKVIAVAGVAVIAAAVAACTPPSGPPPVLDPGPPVISWFGARTARSEAPVLATFGWQVSDPDRQQLTCRIDVDSDGTFEHELTGCRSVDSVLEQFTSAGSHSATLEVSDGDWPPVTATTSVTVTPGPVESYDITLRLDPSMRPEFADAFTRAAQRWESVLVAGVRDVRLDLPAGLFGWVPAYAGNVDDVLIDARDTPIDGEGEVLGQAGGLLIRQPQWQPYYGVMEFDTADLDALWSSGRLDDVILHEMGHVLGLGANWVFTGVVTDLLTDPAYTGAAGVAAYQSLGGDRFVPLEKGGGTGTAIGHWRETTFDDELMTGYLGRRPAKLSEVTIAALADLGYGVDLTAADPYVLPANRSAILGGEPADEQLAETHTEPLRPFLGGLPDPLPASP